MQNLDFNVPGGKLNRGLSVVDSVEILRGRALTDDEYFKAALLGWCIELVRVLASRLDVRSLAPRRSCKPFSSSWTTSWTNRSRVADSRVGIASKA